MSVPLVADVGVSPLPVFTPEGLLFCPLSVHLSVPPSVPTSIHPSVRLKLDP